MTKNPSRGDWVVSPALHAPTDRLDVELKLLASEEQPLKHWSPAHVHLGAAHVMGRIALLEGDRARPLVGEMGTQYATLHARETESRSG